MSTFKKALFIKKEIKKLNDRIDMKINRGLSYQDEARRHRFLMDQKKRLIPSSFWKKSFLVASTFMF